MADPTQHLRRSPLRRKLESMGTQWRDGKDFAVAAKVARRGPAVSLVLADLTPLPRLGFKGRGTMEAMKRRGITVEATPNRAFRQDDGGLCLVLAPGEVILLAPLSGEGDRLDGLLSGWRLEDAERTYPLLRRDSHAWLAIAGPAAPLMFAKLCAVDLRAQAFPDLSIAQTSLAKMSAIITRADLDAAPVYHVLADSAATDYLFECLLDAAREFEGAVVGLDELRDSVTSWQKSGSDRR